MAAEVLALVGPTGAGKSALALEIAAALDAEIVAVDAFTVYRGMDVGTAKPSRADLARVRHHLVDVLDPTQACDVAWFQQAARAAIGDIRDRGRVPLLVGGSGLYYRAVVDPLEFPPTDPAVRAAVAARFDGHAAVAHAALAIADPLSAARIDSSNLRRSVRALEVLELTGRRFSYWRRSWDDYVSVYPGLDVVGLAVARPRLVEVIEARVDGMVAQGLVEECRMLRRLPLSDTARQAIGYREVFDHLDGATSLADAVEGIKTRTRRFAGRQARWFARDPRVAWVDPADAVRSVRDRWSS